MCNEGIGYMEKKSSGYSLYILSLLSYFVFYHNLIAITSIYRAALILASNLTTFQSLLPSSDIMLLLQMYSVDAKLIE
jgi:hypothetical protein